MFESHHPDEVQDRLTDSKSVSFFHEAIPPAVCGMSSVPIGRSPAGRDVARGKSGWCGFVKFTGRNEWPLSCVKRHGGLPVRRASPHRQAGNPLQCIQMGIVPAGEFHEGTVSYYCLIWLEIVRLRSIWPWLNTRLSLVIRIVNQLVSLLW